MNSYHSGVLATSTMSAGGGLLWIWGQLVEHGPSWSVLPPLLFSVAALGGAYWSGRKMRQDMAHADEIHRLTVKRLMAGLPLEIETLDPRRN